MRAAPAPTLLTCHASAKDWFDPDATPAFRLQIKSAGRFVLSGDAQSGEGEYGTSDMPHDLARALESRIARGGVIQFLESGKPLLQGAYGQLDPPVPGSKSPAPWIYLLENVQGQKIKIRCTEPQTMAWWNRLPSGTADPAAVAAPAARQAERTDEEAAATKEQVARAARRNLSPPPPGATRIEGLYAFADHKNQSYWNIGPPGGAGMLMSRVWTEWRYLYFQKNGFVYADLPKAGAPCDKPTVDEEGAPLCTTYRIEGRRIQVGHDERGSADAAGFAAGFSLDDHFYQPLPPPHPSRLAGSYHDAECHGALCSRPGWVFDADGSFASWGIHQGFGSAAGVAGQPIAKAHTSTAHRKGRYRVNGYLVDLHFDDGERLTLPVMVYPGGKTLRVGAKEFVRQ